MLLGCSSLASLDKIWVSFEKPPELIFLSWDAHYACNYMFIYIHLHCLNYCNRLIFNHHEQPRVLPRDPLHWASARHARRAQRRPPSTNRRGSGPDCSTIIVGYPSPPVRSYLRSLATSLGISPPPPARWSWSRLGVRVKGSPSIQARDTICQMDPNFNVYNRLHT